MLGKRFSFFLGLIFLTFLSSACYSQEVVVTTPDGEEFIMDVDPTETIEMLQDKIAAFSNGKRSNVLIELADKKSAEKFGLDLAARNQGGYLGTPRSYYSELSHNEKSDIRFIVTTLANKSLIGIALAKGDLESAGDRIDHVHPLRFLMTVFMDEELKVGIRNIRAKGWIWHQFLGGLKNCLSVESQIGNMKDEFIANFSHSVGVDSAIITPPIISQKWDEFIDLLITHIPRKGDHDRYNS